MPTPPVERGEVWLVAKLDRKAMSGEQPVALVRFTNPTDVPAYRGWDFEVLGAGITLRAPDLRDAFATYLANHRRYFSRIPKHSGRYAEAQRVTELHAMLTEVCDANRDITLDGNMDVWAFSSELMFEGQFVSVSCPECHREYSAGECRVVAWSFGGGLAAEGGRRVACPADHTQYACLEWNS